MCVIIDSKNPKNTEEQNIVDIIEKTIDVFLKEGE